MKMTIGLISPCILHLLLMFIFEVSAKRSFLVIAPKQFDVGTIGRIQITLFDIENSGSVSIQLLNSTGEDIYSETDVKFDKAESRSVNIIIPSNISNDVRSARLRLIGSFGDYSINETNDVGLRHRRELLFINTDKPFYKAGQTVRFRILLIDTDLKPPKEETLGDIWITDQNRIRIAQWQNISFNKGLIQQKLPLPDEPGLGIWEIHVKTKNIYERKSFNVKEYVLPTFEITITPPSFVLVTDQNVTWKICAKYTYGKPVRGKLFTSLRLTSYYWMKENPVIRDTKNIYGCEDVTTPISDLLSGHRIYSDRNLELKAEVIEDGTGSNITTTSSIHPTNYKYTISRENSNERYFRTGLPFRTKIFVKKPDSQPLPNEIIKVCAISRREKWREGRYLVDTTSICKNYTTDEQGQFVFTIPPQHPNTIEIDLELEPAIYDSKEEKQLYKPNHKFSLKSWYSTDGNHLQIKPILNQMECHKIAEFPIYYTVDETGTNTAYYQVMSKGKIVDHGVLEYTFNLEDDLTKFTDDTYLSRVPEVPCEEQQWDNEIKIAKFIGQFVIKLNLTSDMVPKVRLLIYSVTKDGNVLADSTSIDIQPCFENKVKLKFAEEKQSPGSKSTIQLSASPKSICGIGVVDKSVYILQEGSVLTGSKIYDRLSILDTNAYTYPHQPTADYNYCSKKENEEENNIRDDRHHLEPAGYVDAITAFSKAGILVISDLKIETRPCKPSFPGRSTRACLAPAVALSLSGPATTRIPQTTTPYTTLKIAAAYDDYSARESVDVSTIRTYFPETWLWNIYTIEENGELAIKEDLPHSITEWQGSAVCLHPTTGLGISETASITAFQPFFASLTLPYSVIRGETVPIIVTVFNYLKECLPITIHLDQTEDFTSSNDTLSKSFCLCDQNSQTRKFQIKPVILGPINITVTASTSTDKDICENFDIADITRSDTITKPLLVEAEGFLKEETKNTFFCMEDLDDDVFKAEHDILLSEDIVEGSSRAYISITGDLMGPTLEGLENLVKLPTGCGEQNMIRLVPNIVVLDYLKSSNRLSENLRQKAIKHIREGYIRQQKYRHSDGSYSAFGSNDLEGSMWLTAFVVKSFASAARYIDVVESELFYSREWIISNQQENGCFPIIGMVHNQALKGGVGKDTTPAALTAYVLTALLQSGRVNETVIKRALQCIEAKSNPSNYSLALFAYAATLAGEENGSEYLKTLNEYAITEGGMRYWKNEDKSIAVETAAYAILTNLIANNSEIQDGSLQKSGEIARWLTQQRNPYGGFVSTQDTVVALQALGQYASLINRQQLNMGVAIKGGDLDNIFQLDENNELLTQRISVPILPTTIEIEANGQGCALVQCVLRYNIPNAESSPDFILSIQTERKQQMCKTVVINICTSYQAQNYSNMVVLEVKMVSGFVPDKNSISALLRYPNLELRRYEIEDNKVNLYFVKLNEKTKCFSFDVVQDIVIEDTKPANAKIYDYYDQDKILSVPYSIEDKCGETADA